MKWYRETFGAEMTVLFHGNILDYRSYLQNIKEQKATTINAKLSALISFNAFLIATKRQDEEVITKKDLLRIQASYINPSDLDEKDVDAFRQDILLRSGIRDHAIVTIMAYAGTRVSETVSLKLTDVDCVGHEILVRHGKGNKERLVFIGDKVVHAVKEYLKVREPGGSKWLFPGRYGKHLTRTVVNKIFNEFSTAITPHKLRHFYCSNAHEKDYSLTEIANQAGHSNIHTTMRYTNPKRKAMKDKADKL
jgi:site-specific recombinase XerD